MSNILSDLANGAKRLQQINKDLSELELREEILALRSLLMDARQAVMEKDEELADLRAKLKSRAETIEVGGFTFAKGEDGKPKSLPFCPNCLAADGTQIRPADVTGNMFICPKCKATYSNLPEYK